MTSRTTMRAIPPVTDWPPGDNIYWATKERCEHIVSEWKRKGASSSFRICPAHKMFHTAPEWAHIILSTTAKE